MIMYPLLELSQVTLNLELVQRLPRQLAYFHLALPIAQDEDYITVALAQPDHRTVVQMLETVLGMRITPVRADGDAIQQALDQVWQSEVEKEASTVMFWSDTSEQLNTARQYAGMIAPLLGLTVLDEVLPPDALGQLLQHSQTARPALLVVSVQNSETLSELLNSATVSLLLLRGATPVPRQILHILRGHTSDRRVLDWLIPIAHACQSKVTLLTAAPPTVTDYRQGNPLANNLADMLSGEHEHGLQLKEFGQILTGTNVQGRIKIKQGTLDEVMVSELLDSSPYELVAIAAKTYGSFVHNVLSQLENNHSIFLVIKA
jgi:hypothetical protein